MNLQTPPERTLLSGRLKPVRPALRARRITLRTRLMGLMLITSLSLIAVLVLFYYQTEKGLYNEFERKTTQLSKAIQIGLEGSSGQVFSQAGLEEFLGRLNTRGVKEISVISGTDRIVASTASETVGKPITERRKELIFKAEIGQPVTGEGRVYNVIVPVASEGRTLGYIHLALGTEDFSAFLRASLLRRVLAALAVLAGGAVLAFLLAGRYTRPIEELAAVAEQVAEGDLDQRLPDRRRDEIGELSRSFNYMLERLSEDRELRLRLRTAEHLASLGQVAQTMAHEIRNPLNFINLSIEHLRDSLVSGDPLKDDRTAAMVASIKGEIQRISRFVEQYLEYGRPIQLQRRPVDLQKMLQEVRELIAARAAIQRVAVAWEDEPLPPVMADADFLRTCLINILGNALDAMPDGGKLVLVGEASEDQVSLRFQDSGVGMDAQQLARVFEPFFTTKPQGLGLGLALTRKIVEEHGGSIAIDSVHGTGCTVTLVLPLLQESN